jgi:hypothetical protein
LTRARKLPRAFTLAKEETLVSYPYVGFIIFAVGQDITNDKNGRVGEISGEGNSLARVV